MYLYFQPKGGINDIMCGITKALNYCNKYNRTLLVDGVNSGYKINFSDYFNFPNTNIIHDVNKIIEICKGEHTIYPECFENKILDLINGKYNFTYNYGFMFNDIMLSLPEPEPTQNIIFSCFCGGGDGYTLFKTLQFLPDIKKLLNEKYNSLKKPYLCMQIRNTDYKCDYQSLYYANNEIIQKYDNIYIATDDKNVLKWFTTQNILFQNLCSFPDEECYFNLHDSSIDSHTKITDLLCEIYIIAMSDKLISNSNGGFINLVLNCHINKKDIQLQFQIDN